MPTYPLIPTTERKRTKIWLDSMKFHRNLSWENRIAVLKSPYTHDDKIASALGRAPKKQCVSQLTSARAPDCDEPDCDETPDRCQEYRGAQPISWAKNERPNRQKNGPQN